MKQMNDARQDDARQGDAGETPTLLRCTTRDREMRAGRPRSIEGETPALPKRVATESFFDSQQPVKKQEQKLPHWQQGDVWVFLTWRLVDSLPQSKILKWKEDRAIWMEVHPKLWDRETEEKYQQRFNQSVEHWLDAGYGSCSLGESKNAQIVADALRYFNHQRYELADFVVMPNHVHVLFQPINEHALAEIVHSWKSFTAKSLNRMSGKTGAVWQSDYWDRLIRGWEHFDWVRGYIQGNPKELSDGKFILWNMDYDV